jgi:hypothetical protein
MGHDRERIKNPLNALIMILNSSWRRKRIGYMCMSSCQSSFDDVPILVLEDMIDFSMYDNTSFMCMKHHASLFYFTKSQYDLLIYVQDDVRVARHIYDNLLLCEEVWILLHGNRYNVPLMFCPGYVTSKGLDYFHKDMNLEKLYEQTNRMVCGDVMGYGGQLMILNRALGVNVFRKDAGYLSANFDDIVWRKVAHKIWVMIPSQFQHVPLVSTWMNKQSKLRCIDYNYWQKPMIRFSDAEHLSKDDKELLACLMQLFWRYVRGRIDDAGSLVAKCSKDLIAVTDTIVRKIKYYVGGERGERLWQGYLSFKSHLHTTNEKTY